MRLILLADLDDIVFLPRNRAYGAYLLRKRQQQTTLLAFMIGTMVLLLMLLLPRLVRFVQGETVRAHDLAGSEIVARLETPPPIDEAEPLPEDVAYTPPPATPPPPPPQRATVQFVPPEVVEHTPAAREADIAEVGHLDTLRADIGLNDREGTLDGPIEWTDPGTGPAEAPAEVVQPVQPEPDPDPYDNMIIDQLPEPVNLAEIRKRIRYPALLRDAGLEGAVFFRVLVDEQGHPVRHLVVKSTHPMLIDACVEELYSLEFTPGIQQGKPVRVWVALPFRFRLKK